MQLDHNVLINKPGRERIKEMTGCSASIRMRKGWGCRGLTIRGPEAQVDLATNMALHQIADNLSHETLLDQNNAGGPLAEADFVMLRQQRPQHLQPD